MNSFIPFLNRVQNSLGSIEVKGVPDKLWRVLILMFVVLLTSSCFDVKNWCLILMAVIIILTFFLTVTVYIYFMVKKPDYLRSESFHIRKQAIEMLGDKDGLLPTNVDKVINVPYTSENVITYREENVEDEK